MDVVVEPDNTGVSISTEIKSVPTLPDTHHHGAVMVRSPVTGYVYDPTMMLHKPFVDDPEDPHPEQPLRIQRIYEKLKDNGCIERMNKLRMRAAIREEIELVHSPEHWQRVIEVAHFPKEHFLATQEYYQRMSLYLNPATPLCARLSCGGVIETCRAVVEGKVRNAFAIVRPPGHHAEPEQEMGFCFFNNAAVAAKWIQLNYPEQVKKVMILDWDVHHGNGTQKAFWTDPNTLYVSLHLFENGMFYPGGTAGAADQVGEDKGTGYNVNIPWEDDGMGDADYLFAFQKIVMPIAYEFSPDFIIISAGFDAAAGDELGRCQVSPVGYAHMTYMLSSLANGKLVVALEGGYNLQAISNSALEVVKVLLGDAPPKLGSMTASQSATQVLYDVALQQSRYWKTITPEVSHSKSEIEHAVQTVSMSDILKAHRSRWLYTEAKLINTELADPALSKVFEDQVFCSENVFQADTLLLFMHDLGTIHAEIGARNFDAQLEKSYLIDTSSHVIQWAKEQNFGLIDINVMTKTPPRTEAQRALRSAEESEEKKLALFIWDNFVQLSSCQNVVIFGMGGGCAALTHIINFRSREAERRIKASVMIPGLLKPSLILGEEKRTGLRKWYYRISRIICPSTNDVMKDKIEKAKRFGQVQNSGESRPLLVLHKSWSDIASFIQSQLASANAIHEVNGVSAVNGVTTANGTSG